MKCETCGCSGSDIDKHYQVLKMNYLSAVQWTKHNVHGHCTIIIYD